MDAAPYDSSYEEHGILGALKLRVGGLFSSASTPVAIDSSYDQFKAASLLAQEDASADPEIPSGAARLPTGAVPEGEEQVQASSTTTAVLEVDDEPSAEANEVGTSSPSPSRPPPARKSEPEQPEEAEEPEQPDEVEEPEWPVHPKFQPLAVSPTQAPLRPQLA